MANESVNLFAKINPDIQEQAEHILSALGITATEAINLFFQQIVLHDGLPFDVEVSRLLDASALSEQALDSELDKGYQDLTEDRVREASAVFSDIRKKL